MVNDDQLNIEARLLKLERDLARLKDDPSVGQILAPGKFGMKWPARIQGPNGDAYILIREPSGWLTTIAASDFSKDDWTDDDHSLDLVVADLTADSLTADTLAVAETTVLTGDVTIAGTLNAAAINFSGNLDGSATSDFWCQTAAIEGTFRHTGDKIQFFNKGVDQALLAVSGTVTSGTLGDLQTAFHSLVDALEAYGLVTDSTT